MIAPKECQLTVFAVFNPRYLNKEITFLHILRYQIHPQQTSQHICSLYTHLSYFITLQKKNQAKTKNGIFIILMVYL